VAFLTYSTQPRCNLYHYISSETFKYCAYLQHELGQSLVYFFRYK